jgi:hypothetical protein
MGNIQDKADFYKELTLKSMIFSYTIKKGRAKENIIVNSNLSNLNYQNYQQHKLPITMNPLEYGKLITKLDNNYIIEMNNKNIAIITQLENENKVQIKKSDILIHEYEDK